MRSIDLAGEFARLREDYRDIDRLLALPEARLSRRVETRSGWSPEQHLAHLALANELVARNVRSLLRGAGPLVRPEGPTPEPAASVLALGSFPRGRAQSPRMVRPPEVVERQLLLDWISTSRRELEALTAETDSIDRARLRLPHQLLGALTAAQWIRFAAMHTRHHLEIAREILAP